MRCEVCGRRIYGKSYKVIIEGARLTVCSRCAKHGRTRWEEEKPRPPIPKKKTSAMPLRLKTRSRKPPSLPVESTLELVEDFEAKIRQSRRKLRLTHEDLGRKIGEKVSVLKKIETGKMTPDNQLATKLEHALKIKLLIPASQKEVSRTKIPKPANRELTLGDLIQLDEEEAEE